MCRKYKKKLYKGTKQNKTNIKMPENTKKYRKCNVERKDYRKKEKRKLQNKHDTTNIMFLTDTKQLAEKN